MPWISRASAFPFDTPWLYDGGMTIADFTHADFRDEAEEGVGESHGSTATLERPETKTKRSTTDSNGDRFSHYVDAQKLRESKLTGRPCVALCGKVWVPKANGKDFPICPECKRIYQQMMNMSR